MMLSPKSLRPLAAAAFLALPMGLAAQSPADARGAGTPLEVQVPSGVMSVGHRHERRYHRGVSRAVLPPHRVVRRLRRQGFSHLRGLTYIPQRQIYRVSAVTYGGRSVRVRVDARTGRALRVRYVDQPERGRRRGRR